MLGNPSVVNPVCRKISPGPCVFVFDVIEWMKQSSSVNSASRGNRSETILPVSPRGRKVHGLLMRLPFSPRNVISLSTPGIGWLCRLINSGL